MNRCIINSVLIFLIVLIKFDLSLVNGAAKNVQCEEKCVSTPTQEGTCLKKARTNLTLVCDQYTVVSFVRNRDNKTITGFNIQLFSDNNSYLQIDKLYNQLIINNLRGIDSGKNSFQGFDIFKRENPCNYSIYTYGM
jgi:hypothetical protein